MLRAGVGTVAESLSFAPLREARAHVKEGSKRGHVGTALTRCDAMQVAPLVHSFTALAPEALLERCCEEHVEAALVVLT